MAQIRRGFRPAEASRPRSGADEPASLPDSRSSLRGLTDDGDEAWLIRGIAAKLYRCPGCHGELAIGTDHVIVQYVRRAGGTDHHHWHRDCVASLLVAQLRSLRPVPARESQRARLEARGRRPAGGRRR